MGFIENVNKLSDVIPDNIDNINKVAEVTDEVRELAPVAESIPAVANISDEVKNVSDNLDDVRNYSDTYFGKVYDLPTTRRDGSPLLEGDVCFWMGNKSFMSWNGDEWTIGITNTDGLLKTYKNLSDVESLDETKDNLELHETMLQTALLVFNLQQEVNSLITRDITLRVGEIVSYPFKVDKDYLLELNGQYVERTKYPILWDLVKDIAIDDTDDIKYSGYFTKGDGSTTFRLPDYRGLFLRGFDNGRGLNPLTDNKLGDYVEDHFKAHDHRIAKTSLIDNRWVDTDDGNTYVNDGWGRSITDKTGWMETNPKYVSIMYYIIAK